MNINELKVSVLTALLLHSSELCAVGGIMNHSEPPAFLQEVGNELRHEHTPTVFHRGLMMIFRSGEGSSESRLISGSAPQMYIMYMSVHVTS